MSLSVDVRAARHSARQHGLITHDQALALGLTPHHIQRRLETGAWTVADPSVYRIGSAPFTWSTRLLAPCLSTGGLASHRSAAAIWNIGGIRRGSPEISVARPSRFRRDDVRVHESQDLHLAGRRVRDGIPVTGVARTLIDLGAVVSRETVEEATTDAIEDRLVAWSTVLEAFVRHARRGRDGVGAMRWVIDQNLNKAMPQSRLELRFERLLRKAGLPLPRRQVEVADDRGFIGRVDFAYEARHIVIEVDGRSIHARRRAYARDSLRRNRLELAGFTVLVFTWETVVGDPATVLEQVGAALRLPFAA